MSFWIPFTRVLLLGAWILPASVFLASASPKADDVGAKLQSAGPIAFGPEGVLFVADPQAAVIYAFDLAAQAAGKTPGTKAIPGIDQKIAALLGTDPREIAVADLAVNPRSKNAFVAVTRGQGSTATPVLLRVDGGGQIDLVALDSLKFTKVALPNPPEPAPGSRRDPRPQSITDMAYVDGRLFIAGLSNEEFSSKLRSVRYPFDAADAGTSVEIFHGAHGKLETHSPVYTFVPYEIEKEKHLIAGYLCTPLVKFPVSALKAGEKIRGTTIAELGNRNRPLDMIVYKQNGKDYLLGSNTSRGVMKIPTENFGSQTGITEHIPDGRTAGIAYETISQLKGVEQLDLLDDKQALVIVRNEAGPLDLEAVALP
jgi:hypothetical protein